MSDDKVFIDGMIFKAPHPKAPDFVKGTLSVKVSEFYVFCQQHQKEGWLNIDLKVSQAGKYYAELNTFKPTQGEAGKQGMAQAKAAAEPSRKAAEVVADFPDDDIPF